ncbi:hypothetical protein [Pseudosporangium ferrugineum]|uniref:Uncharacterized protein n=1 Tax=Pseudosporangium ferrugineum TaxID=439699 RepID=A0A2T0S918_9ACTN|nr:hypothetical protein [Pseudosporangium ferrugineum]PRY29918.1 hypothetical protein CLV70_10586 [Pseudosporangium ferrugineum]
MTGPVAHGALLLSINYGMFTFRDRWCDAGDDDGARQASRRTVVGASTYQVVAQAMSDRARLTVRVWAVRPASAEPGWDGTHEMELHCPTGEMVADEIAGGSPEVVRLPEPGVYGLRAHWRDRESTHEEIIRAIGDGEAVERLHGKEQFLFDMWRIGPLPPEDDDEEFQEELAHWS